MHSSNSGLILDALQDAEIRNHIHSVVNRYAGRCIFTHIFSDYVVFWVFVYRTGYKSKAMLKYEGSKLKGIIMMIL